MLPAPLPKPGRCEPSAPPPDAFPGRTESRTPASLGAGSPARTRGWRPARCLCAFPWWPPPAGAGIWGRGGGRWGRGLALLPLGPPPGPGPALYCLAKKKCALVECSVPRGSRAGKKELSQKCGAALGARAGGSAQSASVSRIAGEEGQERGQSACA